MLPRRAVAAIHPRLAVVAHDTFMVWLAWTAVSMMRWSLAPNPSPVSLFGPEVWIVIAAQGAIFWWTGLYKGLWRFASLPDLWNIAKAAVLGALVIAMALAIYNRLETVPRTVLVVYPLVLALLLGAPRLLYRYWKDSRLDFVARAPSERVLVLGAGKAGEALVRDLRRENRYAVVGFLDDNAQLRGARVHGVPVLGSIDQLPQLARETAAEMLVIAMPAANKAQMRRAVDLCEATGLPFRTVPRLEDVVAGRSSFNELKEVAIEDLLGREPVRLDWTAIRTRLAGRRVLVTGGGGSIGSELCRQVARLGVESLSVLDQSEYNLYTIEQELRRDYPDLLLNAWLGDCGDAMTCERVFAEARPEVVFHAAAYKHVPLLQGQVREAFRNNVLGTRVVAEAADRHGTDSFVLISTDKAVNPTSIMGACKRVAELFCQNFAQHSRTHFITVRFGNVLDSAGSVVPRFREQIRAGGPVTVTHPEITRYFMTIPEACQLILQAAVLGQGGEIFALDMGEPVKIRDLAEQMIRLAGKHEGSDIAIVYTGLRPGEKLFEELFHPQERYTDTAHAKIFLAQPRSMAWPLLTAQLGKAEAAVREFDQETLRRILEQLLPEFAVTEAAQDNVVTFGPR
ncbi:nucleoside-diphosphate sugar epimerase/dehydratase [Dokdonella fugitiva]|jgi:FlaA1/EpsC-like NDP-sugar epimerase|uniref:FlaA1/EpsC-like NDP-sugar epimerase n=1 Tax=Dokdonella fugitiva TaxID=328517 RepID=A0A4R2I8K1_9GAMM|nr:nucleoside-diphosphate sugar epimerase/dehydratase [Dokdonella fugitiva]TCO40693.1 FlaA1/EpsC-like NDP-sugar epimerase [Dokdonella fugitiva]